MRMLLNIGTGDDIGVADRVRFIHDKAETFLRRHMHAYGIVYAYDPFYLEPYFHQMAEIINQSTSIFLLVSYQTAAFWHSVGLSQEFREYEAVSVSNTGGECTTAYIYFRNPSASSHCRFGVLTQYQAEMRRISDEIGASRARLYQFQRDIFHLSQPQVYTSATCKQCLFSSSVICFFVPMSDTAHELLINVRSNVHII